MKQRETSHVSATHGSALSSPPPGAEETAILPQQHPHLRETRHLTA